MELYPDGPPFDAMVVDERRIFRPAGGRSTICATVPTQSGRFSTKRRVSGVSRRAAARGTFRVSLDVNCRNTLRIVACATARLALKVNPSNWPARSTAQADRAAIACAITALQQELRALLTDHRLEPRQIAILGPASKVKGPLAT